MRFHIAILATLGAALAAAGELDHAECRVPGATVHWRASYCMWLNGTDDFENADVQECFYPDESESAGGEDRACELNLKYKSRMCQWDIDSGLFDGDLEACIDSSETVPRVVREKGV